MSLRSTAVTLQLLPGPSKLLVASALGIGADLLLQLSNPAHCLVYRQPYDDDVFMASSPDGSSRPAADLSTPWSAAASKLPASTKLRRPIGRTAVARLCTGRNLLLTLARNEGLTCLLVLNRYFAELYEEEERAELEGREPVYPPVPLPLFKLAAYRGLFNSAVEWVVQLVRAGLDTLAVRKLHPELSSSLIKDLRASSARKAARYPWWYRGIRVARTSLHSEATLYAADALVSMATECVAAAAWYKGSWQRRLRRLAIRCGLQAGRACAVLAAVSVGNGVGSMSPVKRGLVMFVCAQAASFVTNSYWAALTERLSADGAPDVGGASSGGGSGGGFGGAAAAAEAAAASGAGLPGPAAAAAAAAAGGEQQQQGQRAPPGRLVNVNGHLMLLNPAAAPFVPAAVVPAAAAAVAGEDAGAQAGGPAVADAGVQAAGPDAAEPPPPEPQQRRPVVGGPRLPERPHRRHAGAIAPPPQAPQTPQFKDQRAPTPNQESEEAESSSSAAGASAAAVTSARPGSSVGSQPPGIPLPPRSKTA